VGLLLLILYMGAAGVMAQHDDDEPEVKWVFSVSIRQNMSFRDRFLEVSQVMYLKI
jgi:hypothetical protein